MNTDNVIKIDPSVWRTLTGLQQSVKFYKANNKNGKYDTALEKESRLFKYMFDLMVRPPANDNQKQKVAA